MNYYFLPGTGIFGGIKVGYQFADLLNELGAPCAVVTPDGRAPDWFHASAPTLSEAQALPRITARDSVIFSLPHDYARLRQLSARIVFHCQGTDPLIDPILHDPHVTLLTGWAQAAKYVRARAGRASVHVGISVGDSFFFDGRPKVAGTVAYMPRRGNEITGACRAANAALRFEAIDRVSESEVARILKSCEFFLATAEREWFGLPGLEAMAAGCVVLSVPVLGGMEYLRDGDNCRVAEPDRLPALLRELAERGDRPRLRDRAMVTACGYRLYLQRGLVHHLLENDLAFLAA